jgi:N-glycosidase YbiA
LPTLGRTNNIKKMNITDPIKFYSVSDQYGEFSNFAEYPIMVDGKRWPTSEHYFQAMKFDDKQYVELIRKSTKPFLAAQLGRDGSKKIKRGWDNMRVDVMTTAVKAKFTQYPELAKLLCSTGNREIIEHTAHDDFWGDGGDGSGKNMLGKILMQVRDEIAAQQEGDAFDRRK